MVQPGPGIGAGVAAAGPRGPGLRPPGLSRPRPRRYYPGRSWLNGQGGIMELKVADNPEQARYEITADGELAGYVTYELSEGVIDLQHTKTDDKFRGHGIGGRLIQSTLDSVRERHLTVIPTCP